MPRFLCLPFFTSRPEMQTDFPMPISETSNPFFRSQPFLRKRESSRCSLFPFCGRNDFVTGSGFGCFGYQALKKRYASPDQPEKGERDRKKNGSPVIPDMSAEKAVCTAGAARGMERAEGKLPLMLPHPVRSNIDCKVQGKLSEI